MMYSQKLGDIEVDLELYKIMKQDFTPYCFSCDEFWVRVADGDRKLPGIRPVFSHYGDGHESVTRLFNDFLADLAYRSPQCEKMINLAFKMLNRHRERTSIETEISMKCLKEMNILPEISR